MELTFNMMAEDYCLAYKKREEKLNNNKTKIIITVLVLAVLLVFLNALSVFIKNTVFAITLDIFAVIYFPLFFYSKKKRLINQFNLSAAAKSLHKIKTYDEGLEVINSYEKLFVPWKSLYYAQNTGTHLIILMTEGNGIIAVNKIAFASGELDGIIAAIKNAGKLSEGK